MWYRFKSQWESWILVVDILSFGVLECWTLARTVETLCAILAAASLTGTGLIATSGLTSKSTLMKMILIPNPPDWALRPTKVFFSRSQASHEAYTCLRDCQIHGTRD